MKNIIFIFLIVKWCVAFDLSRDGCNSKLKIGNNHYNVTHTYHVGEASPTDVHYDTFGNLFFVQAGQTEEGFYFNAKIVKYSKTHPEDVPGLPEGKSYSIAVDKKEQIVYFGTGNGIYRYNYETNDATQVSNSDIKPDTIDIDKDSNKYITEVTDGVQELYLLNGDKKIRFNSLEALNEMGIDDKNNIYYIKDNKLYVLKSTHSTPYCIGNVTYDGTAQISFHNHNVYIASDELFYFHENDTGNMKLVKNAPQNVTAVAFDKTGDMVLGVPGKLLKYKKHNCYFRQNSKPIDQ